MSTTGQIIDHPTSGERLIVRRPAASTGGRLFSFELTLAPGGHVPASHVHPRQEESFTLLEGRMRFRRGSRSILATAGQTVVVPPGTVHRFRNDGDGAIARALVEVRPALRMEELFETMADLAREHRTLPNGMPRPLDFALFLQEFRQELQIPFLPAAVVRVGLAPLRWAAEQRGLGRRYAKDRRLVA